jgi:hypothetical protein
MVKPVMAAAVAVIGIGVPRVYDVPVVGAVIVVVAVTTVMGTIADVVVAWGSTACAVRLKVPKAPGVQVMVYGAVLLVPISVAPW